MKFIKIQKLCAAWLLIALCASAFSAPLSLSTELRTARANAVVTTVGDGAKLAVLTAPRPANCAATTTQTQLYLGTMGTPFGTVSNGTTTITAPAVVAASATGTAAWARIYKADGTTCVIDMDVGLSGTTITLNSVTITSGLNVTLNAGTLVEGGQ